MESYRNRPAYQQNDYIGWITRAKRNETKEKRLAQMLDELASGDKYMKMKYQANKGNSPLDLSNKSLEAMPQSRALLFSEF